jgi:hypothetical protein
MLTILNLDPSKPKKINSIFKNYLNIFRLDEIDNLKLEFTSDEAFKISYVLENEEKTMNMTGKTNKFFNLNSELRKPEIKDLVDRQNFRFDDENYDIFDRLMFQCILMNNSKKIDELIALNPVNGSQAHSNREIILKNIAIASLFNHELFDKSLEILNNIPVESYTDQDKKHIQESIEIMAVKIRNYVKNGDDVKATDQFEMLLKSLKLFGDKFKSAEHELKIELPKDFAEAIDNVKSKFDITAFGKSLANKDKSVYTPQNLVFRNTELLNAHVFNSRDQAEIALNEFKQPTTALSKSTARELFSRVLSCVKPT